MVLGFPFGWTNVFCASSRPSVVPRAGDRRAALSLEQHFCLDACRMRLMKVAPSFLPDLRSVRPALAVAREQHFQRLGEARFSGAIAADDDRQARARSEREGLLRSDASEALNRQRREIGAGMLLRVSRGAGGCRAACPPFSRLSNGITTVARGEHEAAPVLLQQPFRRESVVNKVRRSSFTLRSIKRRGAGRGAKALCPWSAQAYLYPAPRAEWRAREITEPTDELEASGRNQQRQLLRKDAPEDHRDDPRIWLIWRRNIPSPAVHLGRPDRNRGLLPHTAGRR